MNFYTWLKNRLTEDGWLPDEIEQFISRAKPILELYTEYEMSKTLEDLKTE